MSAAVVQRRERRPPGLEQVTERWREVLDDSTADVFTECSVATPRGVRYRTSPGFGASGFTVDIAEVAFDPARG